MENKPKPGRKKIVDGIKKQIICTPKEFEYISELLKSIRESKKQKQDGGN